MEGDDSKNYDQIGREYPTSASFSFKSSATIAMIYTITTGCPRIVGREEWHARRCSGYIPMVVSPAPYVVVHHGGIPHYCYDEDTCASIVRGYQDFHMDTHRWIDIGYHFVIGGDGNVYEGRGWDNVGAHAPGYNGQGIGICVIGDYTDHMPNNASLEALDGLIRCGINLGKITPDYRMIGHRQVRATQCPGDTFFDYLRTRPHWTPNPVPIAVTPRASQTKTIDITGSSIWSDLMALGVPNATNVVDVGNAGEKIPRK